MLSTHRKNDFLLTVQVKDAEGYVFDLTGSNVLFVVRNAQYDKILEKSIGNGINVTDAEDGMIEINITNEDTDVPYGLYTYEILLEDVVGARYTILQEPFEILESIVRE